MAAPLVAAAGKAAVAAAKRYAMRKALDKAAGNSGGGGGKVLLGLLCGALVIALVMVSVFPLLLPQLGTNRDKDDAAGANCAPSVGGGAARSGPGVDPTDINKETHGDTFDQLSATQRRNAQVIVQAVDDAGGSQQAAVIALMVAHVETRLLNLASNEPSQRSSKKLPNDGVAAGDGKSVGIFQQQPWWGSTSDRMDIAAATKMFIEGGADGSDGLLDIKGWSSMGLGNAAQAVQKSAIGQAYKQFESFAQQVYADSEGKGGGEGAVDGAAAATSAACGPAVYAAMSCPATAELTPAMHGMKPDTVRVTTCAAQQFPQITVFGGVRDDAVEDHPSGRAVDIMISSAFPDIRDPAAVAYGNQVANWAKENAASLGVQYLIWRQKIWSVERDDEGWRDMESRGSDTANHFDHVHVTTYGDAAEIGESKAGWTVPTASRYTLTASFKQAGYEDHTGQDFAMPRGSPVTAAAAGKVTTVKTICKVEGRYNGGTYCSYGKYVVIDHGGGYSSLYAHLNGFKAKKGDKVTAGQLIAKSGNMGNSSGPHLHFEIRRNGAPINPVSFLRSFNIDLNCNPLAQGSGGVGCRAD